MALTQTAAQQAATMAAQKAAKEASTTSLAAADAADRHKIIADIRVADASVHQARESKTVG
jgi:hypothetical protein